MISKTTFKRDSTSAIERAISVLDGFSIQDSPEPLSIIRHLISTTFSRRARAQQEERRLHVKNRVLLAIETLRCHHLLIANMHEGDPEEQKLAASATAAIERFHAIFERETTHKQHSKWIARFSEKPFIEELKRHCVKIPKHIFLRKNGDLDSVPHKIYNDILNIGKFNGVLQYEVDALKMKARILLRQHGLDNVSQTALLKALRNPQVEVVVDEVRNISTLSIKLDIFSDKAIHISGSFQRSHIPKMPSAPIPGSFSLAFTTLS